MSRQSDSRGWPQVRSVRADGRRRLVTTLGGGPLPLYRKVKLEITRRLSSDNFDPDHALPTEEEFAAIYGVSVGTVRRAMAELVAEKVVIRQQGRGTFLAPHSSERMGNVFWHIARADGTREAPISDNLEFSRSRADAETARRLGIARGGPILRITNLMILSGRPVVVDELRLSQARFPGLDRQTFVARETSIYGLYQSRFKISVLRTVDRLRAVGADARAARLLGVEPGSPLLEIDRQAFTFDEVPIEMRRWRLRSEDYVYFNVTGGDSG